jgi:hypothetical protein
MVDRVLAGQRVADVAGQLQISRQTVGIDRKGCSDES